VDCCAKTCVATGKSMARQLIGETVLFNLPVR
jgi:hypothetical protein